MFRIRACILMTLTMLTLIGLLVGCAQPTNSPNTDMTILADSAKLRILRRESVFQPININPGTRLTIQEITGVDLQIETVPSNNYSSKLKILLTSENLPDIIELSYMELNHYVSTGRFEPLGDHIAANAPHLVQFLKDHPELQSLSINNELYAFPISVWKSLPTAAVPIVRGDIIAQLGLKTPQSFEDLLEILIQIKAVYPDHDIWVNRSGTRNLISNIAYPLGSGYSQSTSFYFDESVDQGRFLYGPAHHEFKKVLEFLNQAYQEGILDPYYALTTVDEWQQKLRSGQALFFYDLPVNIENFNIPLQRLSQENEFIPLLSIKNSSGDSRINLQYETHWLHSYFAISSKSKNIEAAVRILDWLYSEEGTYIANFGVADEAYTRENNTVKINPDLLAQYRNEPFSFRLMQFERGTGQGFFTPYIDQTYQYQLQPKLKNIMDQIQQSNMSRISPPPPPLTVSEATRIYELTEQLDRILFETIDAYIIGEIPVDRFDTDLKLQLQNAGAGELEEILNQAYERFKSSSPNH